MSGDQEAKARAREASERARERIEEAGSLFRKTAPPPEPESLPIEGVTGKTRKTRTYEKSHPIYAFRIRPEDSARLDALAERLQVTRDALASGLMSAVLDAVDGGRLSLSVDREPVQKRDTLGRLRSHVQTTIRAAWANLAEREKGE